MAVSVVDLFKVIQVNKAETESIIATYRQSLLPSQNIHKMTSVKKTGKVIGYRLLFGLLHQPAHLFVALFQRTAQTADLCAYNADSHQHKDKNQRAQDLFVNTDSPAIDLVQQHDGGVTEQNKATYDKKSPTLHPESPEQHHQ